MVFFRYFKSLKFCKFYVCYKLVSKPWFEWIGGTPVWMQTQTKEKGFPKIFKMISKYKRGCAVYDQSEPVSRPQNTILLFDIVIC